MSSQLVIPKMGMTMKDGTVSRWLVPDGGAVERGQAVYLLTTEKVETEVEAEVSGTLHQLVAEGTTLDAGATVGWLLGPGETPPVHAAGAVPAAPPTERPAAAPVGGAATGTRRPVSPNARRVARLAGLDPSQLVGSGPGGRVVSEDVEAALAAAAAAASESPAMMPAAESGPTAELLASPLARRLAEQLGVDLVGVVGTGPGGRTTTDDVRAAAFRGTQVAGAVPVESTIPLRGMRGVIAERMHASLREMAQLSLAYDVQMDAAIALRTALVEAAEIDGLVPPTYTDLVVAAVARALRRHPRLNAVVTADAVVVQPGVHVGVAVALDEGLVVPVVRDADGLALGALAAETRRLTDLARGDGLGLDDMSGGTFSVTTLGMFGVDFFTPWSTRPTSPSWASAGSGTRWAGSTTAPCGSAC